MRVAAGIDEVDPRTSRSGSLPAGRATIAAAQRATRELLERRPRGDACSTPCCTARRTSQPRSRSGARVIRGDVRDAAARARRARRRRCGRAPGGDRRRPGVREGPRAVAGGQRRRQPRARRRRRGGGRRAASSSPRPARTTAAWPTRWSPIDEDAPLTPVSLYAEQKVGDRARPLLDARPSPVITCLRFATVYGVAERMRFDLTVNEFTRDLWDGRRLEVYGEQFWRPYVHVARRGARDRARARGAGGARRRPRLQRRPPRRELPQARPRRADPRAAARARRRASTCTATRIRATTASRSSASAPSSASTRSCASPTASTR